MRTHKPFISTPPNAHKRRQKMHKQHIDKLLETLIDGKWHTSEEVINKTKIQNPKILLITSFLHEFKFIQVDHENQKIRLDTLTKRFLQKLNEDANPYYEEITA